MDKKYDDQMFEEYRNYLGELYKSPQDYLYLSRYVITSLHKVVQAPTAWQNVFALQKASKMKCSE